MIRNYKDEDGDNMRFDHYTMRRQALREAAHLE